MINNYSLKLAIGKAYSSSGIDDDERLAAEIILYEYLLTVIANDSTQANDMSSLVSAYKSKIGDGFIDLKGKYTSYYSMVDYIGKLKRKSLLSIDESVIEHIYSLYTSGTAITDFSSAGFSASQYGIGAIGSREMEYLRRVHESVMAPIIGYYSELCGVRESDMKIISADLSDAAPGKMVLFTIDGISPARVFSDLLAHRINVDFHDIALRYPNILLTTA
jgi:hypothetical protein